MGDKMNVITKNSIEKIKDIKIESISLEASKDGYEVVKYMLDGKTKFLTSKYNVKREIEILISTLDSIYVNTTLIIFGLSRGEYLSAVQKKTSEFNNILIIEPSMEIFKAFSEDNNNHILEDKHINILCQPDEKELTTAYNLLIDSKQVGNIKIYDYGSYRNIFKEDYKLLFDSLQKFITGNAINRNTIDAYSVKWFNSYMSNLRHSMDSYTINDFKDSFKNYPSVVVSAGPSLDKNIDLLKGMENKVLIIAGNRTLKPLLDRGIRPHFVCTIDPTDLIYEMMKENLDAKVPLVHSHMSNDLLVREQKGARVLYTSGGNHNYLPELLDYEVDSLISGGSVAHAAADFAVYCGCSPVIFIGQDLAYTNNERHADSAKASIDKELNYSLKQVEAYGGGTVGTSVDFDLFRRAFETYIQTKQEIRFINSTEGGARIKGTEEVPLKEILNSFTSKEEVLHIYKKCFSIVPKHFESSKVKGNLSAAKERLESLREELIIGREICDRSITEKKQHKVVKNLYKLYRINSKVENYKELDLVSVLLEKVFQESSTLFNHTAEEDKDYKNLIKAFDELYKNIIQYLEIALPIIEDTVMKI